MSYTPIKHLMAYTLIKTFDVIYTDQTFDVIYTDQTFDVIYTDQTFDVIYTDQTFDVIYTDFSKAFDSVPHERLLRKLEHVGIHRDLLNWIRSFLMCRTQCVRVEGKTSTWKKVISGIPQGSVLGPLLFVILINDLPDEVKYNICKMFADDFKIYGLVENVNLNKLQLDLCTLEVWSK